MGKARGGFSRKRFYSLDGLFQNYGSRNIHKELQYIAMFAIITENSKAQSYKVDILTKNI